MGALGQSRVESELEKPLWKKLCLRVLFRHQSVDPKIPNQFPARAILAKQNYENN